MIVKNIKCFGQDGQMGQDSDMAKKNLRRLAHWPWVMPCHMPGHLGPTQARMEWAIARAMLV